MVTNIIGISGIARSGKDSLCKMLLELLRRDGFTAERFALADELKRQIRPQILEKYGVDTLKMTDAEKEKVRPELISFGKEKRKQTSGKYFTSFLYNKIQESNLDFAVVTDIRYDFYEEDEVDWVKKNGGVLIHVEKFYVEGLGEKRVMEATIPDEAENDPKIKRKSDLTLSWQDCKGSPDKNQDIVERFYLHDLKPLIQKQKHK